MLGVGIDQALSANQNLFPSPKPPQPELVAATTELQAAIEEAATGSKAGKQRLKKALREFARLIGIYQSYVDQEAVGDGEKIERSGLQASRSGQKAAPLPAPVNARLVGNNAGELTALVDPLPGAKAYLWMIYVGPAAPTTDAAWQLCDGSTRARQLLEDLTPGTRVWLRCAAINAHGLGPWSDPVSRLVL